MNHIQFDKKLICGPEFVAVRIIENSDELKVGNIWMPQMCHENARTAFCKVENVGSKAAEEYGIAEGDYVIIDRLSTFAHTAPVAAVKYNNVICKTNETNTEYFPLKNMALVLSIKSLLHLHLKVCPLSYYLCLQVVLFQPKCMLRNFMAII